MHFVKPFLRQRFVSYLLLISFFLQSCGLFNASTVPSLKEKEDISSRAAATLFKTKLEVTSHEQSVSEGWSGARLLTLDTQFCVKDGDVYKLYKKNTDPIEYSLYKEDPSRSGLHVLSHLGVTRGNLSLGASVDTSIRTTTNRKDEIKATYVQYDKDSIREDGEDFVANDSYDGGHLVDHKFSAEDSHTDDYNYVPQHPFYNRWLKESIVKEASNYLEIPIYTPNPPAIKVKAAIRYDKIPVAILLVTLQGVEIQDVYCFPNNQYNYRMAQSNLHIKEGMSKEMSKLFKLKEAFHKLLAPAIIHDLHVKSKNITRQLKKEVAGIDMVGHLVEGMSNLALHEEDEDQQDDEDEEQQEDAIKRLAADAFHKQDVYVDNLLDVTVTQLKGMTEGQANDTAFNEAFNALGLFLVDYAMKNALKSEVLNTGSRLRLANIVTDFIESPDVTEAALERVNEAYGKVYTKTLQELWEIQANMNLEEIICFAKIYQRLASEFMHPLYNDGYQALKGMDFRDNVLKFIEILQELYDEQLKQEPTISQMQDLVSLFEEAKKSLDYIVKDGCPEKDLKEQRAFLTAAEDGTLKNIKNELKKKCPKKEMKKNLKLKNEDLVKRMEKTLKMKVKELKATMKEKQLNMVKKWKKDMRKNLKDKEKELEEEMEEKLETKRSALKEDMQEKLKKHKKELEKKLEGKPKKEMKKKLEEKLAIKERELKKDMKEKLGMKKKALIKKMEDKLEKETEKLENGLKLQQNDLKSKIEDELERKKEKLEKELKLQKKAIKEDESEDDE